LSDSKLYVECSEVPLLRVPSWPELSVKNIWPVVSGLPNLQDYFPDNFDPYSPRVDRRFFWGIIGAVYPGLIKDLVEDCRKQRLARANKD